MKIKTPSPARICFIGTNSLFSFSAFKTLCAHQLTINLIILAGHAPARLPNKHLSVMSSEPSNVRTHSISQLAAQHEIPVIFLGLAQKNQWQQICARNEKPDFVFVACFPQKIPALMRNWPRQKSINLHPSLLPKYRGPDPVFWQLQNKEPHTGISLHILSEEMDAGPIAHQHEVSFPTQATRNQLDTLLAHQGALAFVELLASGELGSTPQDESQATYQPWPDKNNQTSNRVIVNKSL